MTKVSIDFAKLFALGREVRYGEGSIYMGFSPKKHGGLHTAAWMNEDVLGQYCFLETSDQYIADTESVHEIGTDEWSVIFQIEDGFIWQADRHGFAKSFASKNGGKDFSFCRPTRAVFFGDYETYERDMTLFRIFMDDSGSLIRKIETRQERKGNVAQILNDVSYMYHRI